MIEWPIVIGGYLAIGSIALYLQYLSFRLSLDRLSAEHERHTADLRMMIEVLQLMIMQGQETPRPNRVTHAELDL